MAQGTNTNTNNTGTNAQSNSSSSNSNNASSDGGRSNNSYYAPFGGWQGFMHSYGLKPWNDDDVAEGRAILEGMKAADREAEAENSK